MVIYIIIAIISYLIGSINFSVILSKKIAGFDVREKGSGNAGSTNMLRSVGKGAAALTLICDVIKGVVAIGIAILFGNMVQDSNKELLLQIAGIMVILGHTYPVFFGFKGGKGVATSLGVLLLSNWQIGLICLVFALAMMALTRMVSLGSCTAAVLFPVLTLFINQHYTVLTEGKSGNVYFIYSVILAAIVLFNHRENIKRIYEGTENRLSFKK
ncbi:MAG: glycerol-3-phosphate 1-O-acyltransferase PlsY [Clostridia bacterium]|nr:glycerol-3-phosphate 1-O-acyltransferase PlsY [Clostridia bacterium]